MRDLAPLAVTIRECLSNKDMVAFAAALLDTLPPHLARLCIVHRITKDPNPKVAAQGMIDELTHHFLPKE